MKLLYEKGPYYVCTAKKGFEVYKHAGTHAVRCASIGYEGEKGLKRAIQEIERRMGACYEHETRKS